MKFHWTCFLESKWQYGSIGSDNGPGYWRMYASLGLNGLKNIKYCIHVIQYNNDNNNFM